MRKIGADGAKYPMTAPQYVDESTPQLGTLLEVMQAAGVASETHATCDHRSGVLGIDDRCGTPDSGSCYRDRVDVGRDLRVTRPLTKLSIVVQRLADNDTAVENSQNATQR